MSRSAEFDADAVAAELCGTQPMIGALTKIAAVSAAGHAESKQGSLSSAAGAAAPAPALRSFRGGAFAHAYISDGKSSDEEKKGGLEGVWSQVTTALSTHPTTERRIAALRA